MSQSRVLGTGDPGLRAVVEERSYAPQISAEARGKKFLALLAAVDTQEPVHCRVPILENVSSWLHMREA